MSRGSGGVLSMATVKTIHADARKIDGLVPKHSIDLVFTSPPYWQCRDYDHRYQIGQERTPEKYVTSLIETLESWKPLLRKHSSVILNIDDVFRKGTLVGIPSMFEIAARENGWLVVNRAVWAKQGGIPQPNGHRLARRHEFIFHLTLHRRFYFDLFALQAHLGQTSNPGDVWTIKQTRSMTEHLAPFPPELARRAILMACPEKICPKCGCPYSRRLRSALQLDESRAQSKRAMALYRASNLTQEHIAAVRAVGISDAGKAQLFQLGANKNSKRTLRLAREAKAVLGGYFREFTFAPKKQVGWNKCKCGIDPRPGVVLDPFMGTGTTLRVARELERNAIGVDLKPPKSI